MLCPDRSGLAGLCQETKPITLEVKDAPIVSVIKQIEQQSGYTFFL